jgi:hypothetical protein
MTYAKCRSYPLCSRHEVIIAQQAVLLGRAEFALKVIAGQVENYQVESPEEYAKAYLKKHLDKGPLERTQGELLRYMEEGLKDNEEE